MPKNNNLYKLVTPIKQYTNLVVSKSIVLDDNKNKPGV